jgi:hypothetical protein
MLGLTSTNGKPVLALLLAATVAPVAFGAEQSEPHFNHTVIATLGTAAPAGGNYFQFTNIALSPHGEVAFDVSLHGGTSGTGIFRGSDAPTRTVALGSRNQAAGTLVGDVSNPLFVAHQDVIFTFTSNLDSSNAILRADGTNLTQVVQDGDPAPDGGSLTLSPGGGTAVAMGTNGKSTITYNASESGGPATLGVFRTDRSGTAAIATDSTPLPSGGTMTSLPHAPAVNEREQVAFYTEIDNGSAFGVFRGDGRDLTTVFVTGQRVSGLTLNDFSNPAINERGQVLALGSAFDASGAATNGLFVGDGTRTVAIAVEGRTAPTGGTYSRLSVVPRILTNRGQFAFTANLTGAASTGGVFRGDDASTKAIAVQGAIAPGTNGATFLGFKDVTMDEDGRVAFVADLTPGVGDTDATNSSGLWMGNSATDLHLVVRAGQLIGGNTLLGFPVPGQFHFAKKTIAWLGAVSGGRLSRSIVLSNIDDGERR